MNPEDEDIDYPVDESMDRLLSSGADEIRKYAETQVLNLKKLSEVGIALSAEKNLSKLLEEIITHARAFSNADAGTLYLMNDEKKCLEFAIVQNETMKIRMGGTSGPITWPSVPVVKGEQPNLSNVSSYVAITGEIVSIPDVYKAEGFDFSGTRNFDSETGYRSYSMLVIPMKNKESEIIGVLQLINALDPGSGTPVPFHANYVNLIAALASQAAVAVTNVKLYKDLENLFDAFIKTIATAIDEKSPYTAGHIQRVQRLTMDIASRINEQSGAGLEKFRLNEDEMKELSIAAWLHDIGKIVTPEHIIDKSTKLEKVFDTAGLIAMRYEALKREEKIAALEKKLELNPAKKNAATAHMEIDAELDEKLKQLDEELDFILNCNKPSELMDDKKIEKLEEISAKKWELGSGEMHRLTEDELHNLSIKKGSLNDEERKIVENHVMVTFKMLSRLPFPKKLRHVREYACAHHEKLNGTGYPLGLKTGQLPYPARIIAIADVFEALTAKDRPYKKPMLISQALKILKSMKEEGHIDPDILDFFIKEKIYEKYAQEELGTEQLDC